MSVFIFVALLVLAAVDCPKRDRTGVPANRDYENYIQVGTVEPAWAEHVQAVLRKGGIPSIIEDSRAYGVRVPPCAQGAPEAPLTRDAKGALDRSGSSYPPDGAGDDAAGMTDGK
jgi:hypothetical protein